MKTLLYHSMKANVLFVCFYFYGWTSQVLAQPTITSFSPTSGNIGTQVTINGTNFNTTTSNDIVFFGAGRATVTAATSTSLTVTVPTGANYQCISVTNLGTNLTAYSAYPFAVTFPADTNLTVATKIDFYAYAPRTVYLGDIDGDGKTDVVIANGNGNSVSVLRNTSTSGSVSFASQINFATGSLSYGVSVGDIDGDGKPDLIVTNYNDNTVSVLRNTSSSGSVSFATKVDFGTSANPFPVCIGDLDGDGKPELIVGNYSGNNVSVLLNTSTSNSISFATRVDFSAGANPYSVRIGDIDGDGKPDVAIANTGTTVSVLRNTSTLGTINFATEVDWTIGGYVTALAIGDIDGDGKPDVAVTNTSAELSVLRNTSTSGTLSFAAKVNFNVGGQPYSVSMGDLDGDGKPDVAVAKTGYYSGSVLRNTSTSGSVSFATKVDFGTGANPMSIVIGDLDRDGKPDLAVGNFADNSVSVIRNTTIFLPPAISNFTPASGNIGATVTITGTNFSNVSSNDIVFFGATRATVTAATKTSLTATVPTGANYQYISLTNLITNLTAYSSKPFGITFLSNNIFSFATKADCTTGNLPRSVCIGDIDGDGKSDISVANLSSNTLSVFRNTSSVSSISFATKVDFTTGSYPIMTSFGDIDGDGKPDLVIPNDLSNTLSILRNTSTSGSISFATKIDFTTGSGPYSACTGDIDGDGKPEVSVANMSSNTISVFRNTSTSGTINFAAKVDLTTGSNPYSVTIGDIDGDGKPDLAIANYSSNTVSVLHNTSTSGTISFATKVDFTTGTNPSSVCIADIDGDGKSDLAVTNYSSNTVSIFRNTSTSGSVSFATKVDFTTGTNPIFPSIEDIDGDGKPDISIPNLNSNSVSEIRNTSTSGTISFAAKADFTTGSNPTAAGTGDIDGDGKPDVAVANYGSNSISVFRNNLPWVWAGIVNNNWSTASNWDNNIVPPTDANIYILSTASYLSQLQTSITITDLSLPSGSKLNLNGQSLIMSGNLTGTGTITGSSNSIITLNGTGSAGLLYMDQTTPGTTNRLQNFTLNRGTSIGTGSITLGNILELTGTLTLANGTFNTGESLTLVSNTSGTARVASIPSTADITGSVKVQRYIPAVVRRYRMLSPNTSSFTYSDLKDNIFVTGTNGASNGFDPTPSNSPSIYSYQESTAASGRGWKAVTSTSQGLSPGMGALVFVRGDRTLTSPDWYTSPYVSQNEVTIDFNGVINKGTITPTVTYTGTATPADDGWNLVGNPYPSPVDWTALTKSNIDPNYYILDPTTGSYVSDNGTNYIASGQAFFVLASGASPSISFTEGAKVSNAPTNYFKTASQKIQFKMIKDSFNSDVAWLEFNSASSKAFARNEDVLKFFNSVINIGFYIDSNTTLQRNSVPKPMFADTFIMYANATVGTYTLQISNMNTTLPSSKNIYLLDLFNSNLVNLRTTSSYSFTITSSAASHGNRFLIIINNLSALPVSWLSFSGEKENKTGVLLKWQTANEKKCSHFVVERSMNKTDFDEIGLVNSLGNSNSNSTYQFIEKNIFSNIISILYYRIMQVDKDGKSEYSSTISVKNNFEGENTVSVFPNPAKEMLNINFYSKSLIDSKIEILDLSGKVISTEYSPSSKNEITISTLQLDGGIYLLRITAKDGEVITTKFAKE